jgi:hypothetical protein
MHYYRFAYIHLSAELLPDATYKGCESIHSETIFIDLIAKAKDHVLDTVVALRTPDRSQFHLEGKTVAGVEPKVEFLAADVLFIVQTARLPTVQAKIVNGMPVQTALRSNLRIRYFTKRVFAERRHVLAVFVLANFHIKSNILNHNSYK